MDKFDVVSPCHPKDFAILKYVIQGIKKYLNYNKIYLITPYRTSEFKDSSIQFVFDSEFENETNLETIKKRWEIENEPLKWRSPWIFQQTLKLLSHRVIKNLTDSYLILDADTVFIKKILFDTTKFQYIKASEYHLPYLKTFDKIMGGNTCGFSTISHHMMFNKFHMENLINNIEQRHKNNFLNCLLDCIDYNGVSTFSEWDLYANYMLINHPELSTHRQLKWKNDCKKFPNIFELYRYKNIDNYDFISVHDYSR